MNAALDAAITTVPRLFIADWMTIFDTAKTALWIPAGSPIFIIILKLFRLNLIFFGSTFIYLSDFTRRIKSIIELTAFEITVAVATPLTVILRTITKKRLRITLRTPDTASAISGTFVSPMLLKIAASKLYSNITGRPIRYILKYITARGMTSSGTLRELSILPTKNSAITATIVPPTSANIIEVCTAR